jgi:methyltransferase (TIGR00027 family)
MDDHQPSRTAWRVAVRRAAHQVFDVPRVFDDPLAIRILGPDASAILERERANASRRLSLALRAFMAVRSRIAEECLADAYARGVRQYIVLGAGLDTFAYRNVLAGLRVFEVDHPATQKWKRELLAQAGIVASGFVEHVAVDFERRGFMEVLGENGFDAAAPACFAWLGVSMYLNRETVIETVRSIAALPRPSTVVFDYGVAKSQLGMMEKLVLSAFEQRVAAIGEPWTCYFEPADLAIVLRSVGFERIDDLGRDAINERYFANRADGLQVGTLAHLMIATN